jgi:hypothetical protein
MPHAFLCDFDGTIAPSDIGAQFARRFSPDGLAESPEFLAAWMRDDIGHRALTVLQCSVLRVTRERRGSSRAHSRLIRRSRLLYVKRKRGATRWRW